MNEKQNLRTQFKEASHSPGLLLWRTTMRWQRVMTAVLAPLGLTHVQFVLLASAMWLGRTGRLPNQAQLASQAGTDIKMTSDVIVRLEGKGFITREADPEDSRAKKIKVTAVGADLAKKAIAVVETADAAFFAAVENVDLVRLLQPLAGEID